jgi:ParB-like chromosome segregation protein Spo0J
MKAASASAAEYVAVASLRPWAKNPRKNDPAVKAVADSIKRFGFGAPLIARRENGEIIAGHTRLKAAIKLGLAEVPVRYLDLSEAEAHALALADNRVGELADWDAGALSDVLRELEADSVSLDALGWDEASLRAIIDAELPTDDEWGKGMDGLPDADRQPFQQMTFTVHDGQADEFKRALAAAKGMGAFDGPNENSNGNALARMAEMFLTTCARG